MRKRLFAWLGVLALLAPLAAARVEAQAATPPPQTTKDATSSATPGTAKPPARHAGSPEEAAALKSLLAVFNDPATAPSVLDAAINSFLTQFPKSEYTLPILIYGERYARVHSEYLLLLEYGVQVLKLDPHNIYVLSSLGSAIPDNVKPTDLDMDQRLAQAADFDQQVIAVASGLVVTSTGVAFQGTHYTAAQAATLKNNLEGPAYLSLGHIATLRKQFPEAAEAYAKALPFESTANGQAQVYFEMGQSQASAQQTDAADATFAKALALAPKTSMLGNMIRAAQAKLHAPGGGA